MKKKFKHIIIFSIFLSLAAGQSYFNSSKIKKILYEKKLFNDNSHFVDKKAKFNIILNNYLFLNNNLPNFENHNGLYIPKGFGRVTGMLFYYKSNNLEFSAEPKITEIKSNDLDLIKKEKEFSVLNDVPLPNRSITSKNTIDNFGFKLKYHGMQFGYGNWSYWLGPGFHNSILMTNNAKGITSFSFGTNSFISINEFIKYNFNFIQSKPIRNSNNANFYISSWQFRAQVSNVEIAVSEQKITGGYNDMSWDFLDAATVFLHKKNNHLWDTIRHYHFIYKIPDSGLKVFIELGHPNRSFGNKNPSNYREHTLGTNMGLRKYGLFGMKNILAGFEYARLLQSPFYNILPSQNWYDNVIYDYSSYKGRRWAAHSGTDSDDFIFFAGYVNENISAVIGWNYERHGVSNYFPPEVKFENRFDLGLKIKNIWLNINYENEYFEHYGFIDNNYNVWTESYNEGSIQRTKSLLLVIEYKIK